MSEAITVGYVVLGTIVGAMALALWAGEPRGRRR